MAKVKLPLFSGDVSGDFGKKMIFRKGGVVSKYFKPRNPKSVAQQAQRGFMRSYYMGALTQAVADLLYSALGHLHDDRYLQSVAQQDHGSLAGLGDDDHSQYFNQTRGDERYLQSVPQQDHGGLAGLGDDDHSQYLTEARGDARYLTGWQRLLETDGETIYSTTTLHSHPDLTFSVLANKNYHVRGRLIYITPAAADFKYRFLCDPDGYVITKRVHIVPNTSTLVPGFDVGTSPTTSILGAAGTVGWIEFDAVILNYASDRTWTFQFAQVTSNAGATTLNRGSYVEYLQFP
jgi:hypothetical protein